MRTLIYGLFLFSVVILAGAATGHLQKRLDDTRRLKVIEGFNDALGIVLPNEGKTITAEDAVRLQRKGEFRVIYVDLRDAGKRAVARIPGSVWGRTFDLSTVDFARECVIYYDLTGFRALNTAIQFQTEPRRGKLFALKGGLLAWLHAGQPVVDENNRTTNRVDVGAAWWGWAPQAFTQIW